MESKKEALLNAARELEEFAEQLKLCEDVIQRCDGYNLSEKCIDIKNSIEENIL